MGKEMYYCWEWKLKSSPQDLWPLVADTDRFNRDTALPPVQIVTPANGRSLANARRTLKFRLPLAIIWEEEPFQWDYPAYFSVVRNYRNGPLQQMRVSVRLLPTDEGGTHLIYETWVQPRNILGTLGFPFIGLVSKYQFGKVMARYDELALANQPPIKQPLLNQLASGAKGRLEQIGRRLTAQGLEEPLVQQLVDLVTTADDITLSRLQPYVFADQWRVSRARMLELFLRATREGLLDLQWDILCPLCRGSENSLNHLSDLESSAHCDSCQIDFDVNFHHSVELTFTLNSAIRVIQPVDYCVAGPEMTPHIVAQQLLPAQTQRTITPILENGRYRLRTLALPGGQYVQVTGAEGQAETCLTAAEAGWAEEEVYLASTPTLHLDNQTDAEQLMILERMTWRDTAVTAAEVTTLQQFRDLFADEVLRPGEQISVGSLTILFTDLRDSTRLYREIGDATAFGLVMDHFGMLQEAIATEEGAIVKTIGDAVMAVFRRPVMALQAILTAQQALSSLQSNQRPLTLKASLHYGPSIAVNLNERLDYFGSTINIAARLEKFSQGNDVIMSEAVYMDPEVQAFLETHQDTFLSETFTERLKGFDDEYFHLWRVARAAVSQPINDLSGP